VSCFGILIDFEELTKMKNNKSDDHQGILAKMGREIAHARPDITHQVCEMFNSIRFFFDFYKLDFSVSFNFIGLSSQVSTPRTNDVALSKEFFSNSVKRVFYKCIFTPLEEYSSK
jgi:hypothetical protein